MSGVVVGTALMPVFEVLGMAPCGGLMGWWSLMALVSVFAGFSVGGGRLGEASGSGMRVDGGHWDNAK